MKTIWSSSGVLNDVIADYTADEKRDFLKRELFYDPEMVDGLPDDELDGVIADNPSIYQAAEEDLEFDIAPEIAKQVRLGLVLDRKFNFVDPGAVIEGEVADAGAAEVEIFVKDNGTVWFKVEGQREFPFVGFSEDEDEYIDQLEQLGIADSLRNLYPGQDLEDFDIYDIYDLLPMNDLTLEVLTPVRDTFGVNVEEELVEAKAKNPTKLADEIEEIKDLAEEYGKEYFTQMPFTSFDNDPISIEVQYPEFFRVVKSFFKEMDILSPEELEDSDELDFQWDQGIDQHDWDVLMKVCDKLAQGKGTQIEKEYKTGYNSPLDDDEILAKREEESLQEDEQASPEEVLNKFNADEINLGELYDQLSPLVGGEEEAAQWLYDHKEQITEDADDDFDDDDEWYHYDENGLIDTYWLVNEEGDMIDGVGDFNTAMAELPYYPDAVKIIHKKSKDESFRWFDDFEEVMWEKGVDESLTEAEEPRKFEEDNRFIYVGTGDDQHDIGEIWDDGTIELYEPEKWSKEDREKMLKDLKSLGFYDLEFLGESLDEESLNEEIGNAGINNADLFLDYLKEHDCDTTGAFAQDPVDIKRTEDGYEISLNSQAGEMDFIFHEDGSVGIEGYEFDDEAESEVFYDEWFETWNDFAYWYNQNEIAWTSDLGSDIPMDSIGESLTEETATWPWGDPDSVVPHKEVEETDSLGIDKYL